MLKQDSRVSRRTFLQAGLAGTAAIAGGASLLRAAPDAPRKKVLLRSSWQTVNIGDIAHTPGVLRLLEEHVPEADVALWPSSVDNGVREMLLARFPKLQIVKAEGEVRKALAESDFFLHGSGPSVVGAKEMARWARETKKPYGLYGVTIGGSSPELNELLTGANFVYCRDSKSLELIKKEGVKSPIMEFGPDGAFATDLRNDAAADAFLASNDLVRGKFLCVIPRYRYTPYWLIPSKKRALDEKKHARNMEMREHDCAPLRAAIEKVVRETDHKVLICPEDQTQMAIGREMLYDKLPDDVKPRVVWRENYWLTDEALSTYVRSAGMFGLEMHTPIMCIGNGVPAIVGRFAEQTTKGFMWQDIGLGDWLFDMDQAEQAAKYPATVLSLVKDREQTMAMTKKACDFVKQRQRATMNEVRRGLGLAVNI
jgi:polysaccharide pyruvyl transferase WcaK-like protein